MNVLEEPLAAARSSDALPPEVVPDSRFSCNICLESVEEPVVTQCGHLYCWPCLFRWLEPGMLSEERRSLQLPARMGTVDGSRRVCPVCKAPCSVPKLVPIYVRNTHDHQEHSAAPTDQSAEGEEPAATNDPPEDPTATTGLRLRFRSRDSEIPDEDDVPSRPAAAAPVEETNRTSTTRSPWTSSQLSPTTHTASLSHGLALSLQQAFRGTSDQPIPSLHQPAATPGELNLDSDPDATEFLSRLLLMLGSFVVLCLLLF